MALTIGTMAKLEVQTALTMGRAQAADMGLGSKSAGALSINNLMQRQDQKGLMSKLMSSGIGIGKSGSKGLGLSSSRLRGTGLTKDLMAIGKAALAIGPGRGTGLSASSSLRPSGGIISKLV